MIRSRKRGVPARPIAENHRSTRKQGLQEAQISERNTPSETLTSHPPLRAPRPLRGTGRETKNTVNKSSLFEL